MKIDIKELDNQRKEKIIKSGKYAKVEIIVSEDIKESPICWVTVSNGEAIAALILTVKETLKNLEKEYPAEALYSKLCMGCKSEMFNSEMFGSDK